MMGGKTGWLRGEVQDDRGSIGPFIVVLFPALIALMGLAFDGGNMFAAGREANNVAAAAARAGANEVLESSIYAGDPELAPTAVPRARVFAHRQGATTASARAIEHDLLEVTVTQTVDMEFLSLFGIDSATVTGQSQARVRDAVVGP